jgi:putative Mg2+ transporter-C (MgtC) family protein
LALGTLSYFRRIEDKMPSQTYARYYISFKRDDAMPEDELRALLMQHGFNVAAMGYDVKDEGKIFEYRMVIRTGDAKNPGRLAEALRKLPRVHEFRIWPTGG